MLGAGKRIDRRPAFSSWIHDCSRYTTLMRIEAIICPEEIEVKIETKHDVRCRETRQVLMNSPRVRFAEKGHTPGHNVYAAFGQTFGGRYLSVFFIYKPESRTAIIISARDMSDRERKAYGRK